MSYGPADKLAAIAAPIDPELYRRDDIRRILAERDVTALYQALKDAGLTQRTIVELTGQSQSEVSEILGGRRVLSHDVLVRICEGLRIPRELMGLSYGAYAGDVTVAEPPTKGGECGNAAPSPACAGRDHRGWRARGR